MASFNIIKATTTSFVGEVSGLDTSYASNRDFYWYAYYTSGWQMVGQTLNVTPDITSVAFLFRGLAWGHPGERWYLGVDIYPAGATSADERLVFLTADSLPASSGPTLSASNVTSASITVSVTGLPVTSSSRSVSWWRLYPSQVADGTVTIASNTTSVTHTYSGLSPDTQYGLSVVIWKSGSSDPREFIDQLYLYATTLSDDAEEFEWDYAGCTTAGVPVAGTEKSASYCVYVSAAEWNRLVDCVNDLEGTSISHVSSGNAITAAAVNQVANAVGAPTVSSGGAITAAFFNNLKNCYNNSI